MKNGLAELSVPAVAKAARVSVPTVYRHFPSKRLLFAAVGEHVGQRSGLSTVPTPADLEAMGDWVRETFRRLDTMDPAMAAAMGGALGGRLRRQAMLPHRLKIFDASLAPALRALPPREREHLRRVTVLLTSSAALRTLKSYLDLSADEAAQTVVWALDRLTAPAEHPTGGRRWNRRPRAKNGT